MSSLMVEAEIFPTTLSIDAPTDDGKITKEPIQPEFIRNKQLGHHRLIFRTSIKLEENEFISLSFVLDRSAPSSIYFSPGVSVNKLVSCRRIIEDGDVVYMDIDGKKAAVKDYPTHSPTSKYHRPTSARTLESQPSA
jgi:hypothetical protein